MKQLVFLIALIGGFISTHAQAKTTYRNALVMAYSPANSVYEDDNLRLEIYNEALYATNKTARTIFIEQSQCFLNHNGSSFPMFGSAKQDEKQASAAKKSMSIEEFRSIPPATGTKQNATFICNLTAANFYGSYSTAETPSGDFSEYDERFFTLINELVNESLSADPEGKQCLGSVSRHLTEDESIKTLGVTLAYSFSKRTEEWTPVTISTWISDVCFAPYYIEMPKKLSKKDKQGFGIKKTDAAKIHIKADSPFEFEQDKSPLIVCDWNGNFKKGTFNLSSTRVTKLKSNTGYALLATLLTGGLAASTLLLPPDEIYYKSEICFNGTNVDWGKMTYMKWFAPTEFKVKR